MAAPSKGGGPIVEGMSENPADDMVGGAARNFVMFNDMSYFRNPTRIMKTPLIKGTIDALVEFVNFMLCPVYKVDTLVDKQLEDLVKMYIILDCVPERQKQEWPYQDLDDVVDPNILWNEGDDPLEVGVNRLDNFQTMEGFNYNTDAELMENVTRFRENHAWIKTDMLKARLATYYLSELNRAENATGAYLTTTELVDFNNVFDNSLEDLDTMQKIRQTEASPEMKQLFLRTPETTIAPAVETPSPAPKKRVTKCDRVKQRAVDEFNRTKKVIKNELYALLIIPVVLYVTYNVFFVMFSFEKTPTGEYVPSSDFKDLDVEMGLDPPLPPAADDGSDLDELNLSTKYAKYAEKLTKLAEKTRTYYAEHPKPGMTDDDIDEAINKQMKSVLKAMIKSDTNSQASVIKFLFEFVFKPTKLVYSGIEYFKGNSNPLNSLFGASLSSNQTFVKYAVHGGPLIFMFTFTMLYGLWTANHDIFKNMVARFFKQQYPKWLAYMFGMIMGGFGAMAILKDVRADYTFTDYQGKPSISKTLVFLVKWFFKVMVNMSLVGSSVSIAWAYLLYYFFLGIWTKNDQPTKEVYKMDEKNYDWPESIINLFNSTDVGKIFGGIIGVLFTYMIEIFVFSKVGSSMKVFNNKVKNAGLKSFLHAVGLLILLLLMIYIFCIKPFTNVWFRIHVIPKIIEVYNKIMGIMQNGLGASVGNMKNMFSSTVQGRSTAAEYAAAAAASANAANAGP
jgi:hypothetical protein